MVFQYSQVNAIMTYLPIEVCLVGIFEEETVERLDISGVTEL